MRETLDKALGSDKEVSIAEYIERITKVRDANQAELTKASGGEPARGAGGEGLRGHFRSWMRRSKSRTNTLKVLRTTNGSSKFLADVAKFSSKVAGSERVIGLVGKGARLGLKLGEFVAMAVAGPAITNINRYLASRQALKIVPLRNCGKEWTAGINGHLGACVGDPLGPADKLIEFLLGTGKGSMNDGLVVGGKTIYRKNALGALADQYHVNVLDLIGGFNDPGMVWSQARTRSWSRSTGCLARQTTVQKRSRREPRLPGTNGRVQRRGVQPLRRQRYRGGPRRRRRHGNHLRRDDALRQDLLGLVSKLAQLINVPGPTRVAATNAIPGLAERDGDLSPGACDARISRVMEDAGLGNVWSRVGAAKDRAANLRASSYWKDVTPPTEA